jgi:hypothetical protein
MGNKTPAVKVNENDFLRKVVDLAHIRGWLVHHDRPARTSQGWRSAIQGDPGFPDLVLARNGQTIIAELKTGDGRLTLHQKAWIEQTGCHVWRPTDWPTIMELLR